jgi:adenosylhomocysteine nucleosidase
MTIAILSALAEEQQGLIELLQKPQAVQHAGRTFHCGELQGQPVVLALSRIGKVAAATTAAALVERFGVRQIIFTGVAGGLGPGVKVGDVVVASEFLQHDMDASPLFPRYEVPLYGRAHFSTDTALSAVLLESAQALGERLAGLIAPATMSEFGMHQLQAHHGLVISGDRFVATTAESSELQAAHGLALAVEMEGAAVAQVCFDYGIAFAAVRTISDRADDTAHVDFPRFVEAVASHHARFLILESLRRM